MSLNEQDHTPTEQSKQQPKLDPSPTKQVPSSTPENKKTASYTYWVDEKNKSRELPPEQRPKKIQAPVTTNQQSEGRSHWNTAGTWENKKISVSDIEKQYTEKLSEWLATTCPQAKVSKVSLNGQCEVVFSRNKKSLTYEITGKVEFQKNIQSPKEEQTEVEKEQLQKTEGKEGDSLDLSSDEKESPKIKKKSKSSGKAKQFSIEITDLTDSGDRDHSVKADTAEDKKWISSQSSKALSILEDILKAYK